MKRRLHKHVWLVEYLTARGWVPIIAPRYDTRREAQSRRRRMLANLSYEPSELRVRKWIPESP